MASSVRRRNIPAHAGKTNIIVWALGRVAEHPRSRGENDAGSTRRRNGRGTSPLTRGKPQPPRRLDTRQRNIPAHAGKTPADRLRRGIHREHPRSRGENGLDTSTEPLAQGTSPLTRGKRDVRSVEDGPDRNIPAHAGKTPFASWLRVVVPEHPRSRGENVCSRSSASFITGTSPLTRGKRFVVVGFWVSVGNIPAHAGKTQSRLRLHPPHSEHPRSRGENVAHDNAGWLVQGTSPLTRGKPRPE